MGIASEHGKDHVARIRVRKMWAPMGAASGLKRRTEGMPEMQKSVLEYAAPKANQNQGLESHLADEGYCFDADNARRVY